VATGHPQPRGPVWRIASASPDARRGRAAWTRAQAAARRHGASPGAAAPARCSPRAALPPRD